MFLSLLLCLQLDSLPPTDLWKYWNQSDPSPTASLSPSQYAQLQEGDVLLRRGFGPISRGIVDVLKETYPLSHCGMLLQQDSSWWVLHSIAEGEINGTYLQPLKDYLQQSQAQSLMLVRLEQQEALPAFKSEMLRIHNLHRPFDFAFNHNDSSALYCAEFIDLALRHSLGQGLKSETQVGNKKVLGLKGFWTLTSPFKIVFHQFPPLD